ncbi:MAG: hypothetical protein IJ538_00205 [Clostridia bacterium]|nr:hypothetical protein [Clostridia bacterium]
MKYYDADYIIRKNNEYEELEIYNSPAERKLREMIAETTRLCAIQEEKLKRQREKLMAKRREKELAEENQMI